MLQGYRSDLHHSSEVCQLGLGQRRWEIRLGMLEPQKLKEKDKKYRFTPHASIDVVECV